MPVLDDEIAIYTGLGYSGSLSDMRRLFWIAYLALSNPERYSNTDLEYMYLASQLGDYAIGASISDMYVIIKEGSIPMVLADPTLPDGYKAHSFSRLDNQAVGIVPVSGKLYGTRLLLTAGTVVNSLTYTNYTPAIATPTHAWAALYGPDNNLVAQSVDEPDIVWAAFAVYQFNLPVPYTVPKTAYYNAALMIAAAGTGAITGNVPGVGASRILPYLGGTTADVGLLDTAPASLLLTPGQGNSLFYVLVK